MPDFFRKPLIRPPMRPLLKVVLLALFVLVGNLSGIGEVDAGSCAYREAMMALDKGNAVRGLALMRMASRDGDHRAGQYLREQDHVAGPPVLVRTQRPLTSTLVSASRY